VNDLTQPRRRGRRPAAADTRGLVLAAAKAEFTERGYDATTLRGIARRAQVDARTVHHYFDGKDALFVEAIRFPARPQEVLGQVLADLQVDDRVDGLGEMLVRVFLGIWESDGGGERVAATLGAASSSPALARLLREFVTREIMAPVRACLAASQMIGVAMLRYVIKVEPLASADADQLAMWLGPTIQRYIVPGS
jgi:AcrR family transcriptional regulator